MVRRRRNLISEIKTDDGQRIHSRQEIKAYFSARFHQVFQSSHLQVPSHLEGLLSPCISEARNNEISRIPDATEIREVVWSMHPLKASGPDGLPGLFFKKYWPIVGDQMEVAIQSFFRDGWLLKNSNHTFITLIPKRQAACNFNHFRPISLCNFYYKIISKIIVNRMRPLLSKIIDLSQVAFVPNHWIAKNVFLAQEIVHSFKKSKRKKGSVGFKLDFHKAYDYLEWDFIIKVLGALGFNQNVSNLIFQCISPVRFTLLLNGSKSTSFSPSRGIRQGDSLSPYLFILCSEVLARLIDREVGRGNISSVKVCPKAPTITKIFYADDVLLLCGAKISKVESLIGCIDKCCSWFGQSVNIEKSGIFVSNGVHNHFIRQVKAQWGFNQLAKDSKYLSLPLFLSSN